MTIESLVPVRVALLGPPNVGKTSLFNGLTGLFQKIGNYAGVTVEKCQGRVKVGSARLELTDLPGTPSLITLSPDEEVVTRFLEGQEEGRPDVVAVVLDATQLRRGFFLLSQVLEFGIPTVVCLNMIDEARMTGLRCSAAGLEKLLGLPCVETIGSCGEGLEALKAAMLRARSAPPPTRYWTFPPGVEEKFQSEASGVCWWDKVRTFVQKDPVLKSQETIGRYRWAEELLGPQPAVARTESMDRFLLHPVLGPAIFILIMGLVFQSIFSWAVPMTDRIDQVFGAAGEALRPVLGDGLAGDLVIDGALAGVGSVMVFLPQILLLFFFIGLLEDTGYMMRAAFIVDRPLSLVGLSGRSFIPLLSSYACAIPGIMAARTITSPWERLKTILIAPLMTCSARLPVYALLIAAFIPATKVMGLFSLQALVLLGLYLMGLVGAVVVAWLLGARHEPKKLPMVLELPPYRRPTFRVIATRLWHRTALFLKRAGTIILLSSVLVWGMLTFPRTEPPADLAPDAAAAYRLQESYGGRLGKAIQPLIEPLGYDWKIGIGLIASLAAREVFVSTLGIVYAVGEADEESDALKNALMSARHERTGQPLFTVATVLSLLVFYVFALQCISTLAVVWRETRSVWLPIGQFFAYFALAWISAFVTYRVALFFS